MSKRFLITATALALLFLLAACVAAAKLAGEHFVKRKLDSAIHRVRDKAAISYQDVDIDFILLDLSLNNLTITLPDGQFATIDRITVKDVDYRHSRPLYLTLEVDNISLDVTPANMGEAAVDFTGLGYSHIGLDLRLDYRMDTFTNRLQLKEFRVDAPGLGTLRTTFRLSNVHMDKVLKGLVEGVIIEDFFLFYEDDSLARNLFTIASDTEPEFMDFFIEGLEEDLAEAREEYNERGAHSIGELIAFLRNPQALSMSVNLQRPVAVRNILLFKKISDLLTLFSITFESGPGV